MAGFGIVSVSMALKISAIDKHGTYFECHAWNGTP